MSTKTHDEIKTKMGLAEETVRVWSMEVINRFNKSTSLKVLQTRLEIQGMWKQFKIDCGVPDDMRVTQAKHIPDAIKRMIDRVPEEAGDLSGLNFIHARHWEAFKSMLLLSGARVDEHKWISVPVQNGKWVHIGMRGAINVGDLNTFFGVLNGTYHLPTGGQHQPFPGAPAPK